tara:strand:+ start:856 stop:1068 length:213 start_codon:yes stop_codon:yes gene_type:complete
MDNPGVDVTRLSGKNLPKVCREELAPIGWVSVANIGWKDPANTDQDRIYSDLLQGKSQDWRGLFYLHGIL